MIPKGTYNVLTAIVFTGYELILWSFPEFITTAELADLGERSSWKESSKSRVALWSEPQRNKI